MISMYVLKVSFAHTMFRPCMFVHIFLHLTLGQLDSAPDNSFINYLKVLPAYKVVSPNCRYMLNGIIFRMFL